MEAMIALHPTYPESRGDPKKYLDVRQKFAQIAQQSPEMGEQGWWRPRRRYRTPDGDGTPSEAQQSELVAEAAGRSDVAQASRS